MKLVAVVLVVLALVIGVVPQFTDCESDGRSLTLENGRQIPMKCHWTARAEIGVAVPLAVVGGMMVVSRRRESRMGLAAIAGVLGVVAIGLPGGLIGVCGNPDMVCNAVMKPTLTLAGALTVATGVLGLVAAGRQRDALS